MQVYIKKGQIYCIKNLKLKKTEKTSTLLMIPLFLFFTEINYHQNKKLPKTTCITMKETHFHFQKQARLDVQRNSSQH